MNRRGLLQLAGAALVSGVEATRAYSFLNGFGVERGFTLADVVGAVKKLEQVTIRGYEIKISFRVVTAGVLETIELGPSEFQTDFELVG
jgi:hypothetical protein